VNEQQLLGLAIAVVAAYLAGIVTCWLWAITPPGKDERRDGPLFLDPLPGPRPPPPPGPQPFGAPPRNRDVA
jgi:hypothetical protein